MLLMLRAAMLPYFFRLLLPRLFYAMLIRRAGYHTPCRASDTPRRFTRDIAYAIDAYC